ncbi:HAMP domain-containing sensor histidine kinase [Nonomuraea sp. NPDC000554]|uniref:sensor histidine kinase n=1 Tax=Nonomuraea sp. NPDC000554 TaxID=3154259 RepID=UPI00332CC9CE
MPRNAPIRARLAATAALAVAVVVVALTWAAYLIVGRELNRELDLSLIRTSTRVQLQVKAGNLREPSQCGHLASPGCVQLLRPGGGVMEPVSGAPTVPEPARQVARGEKGPLFVDGTLGGQPIRSYVAPLHGGGAIMTSVRSDAAERGMKRIGAALLALGGGGILTAGLAGYFVARTGLRPITRLTSVAETIAATRDPSHRIEVHGVDEVARLSSSFNTMLGELDRSLTAQRQLIADASHELRTPLTSLSANIELLKRDLSPEQRSRVSSALRRQSLELSALVNDLIELARGEEAPTDLQELRLDTLVADCVARARRNWPQVEFAVSLDPTQLVGVRSRLARAINNLLDNAAKFGDGRVEVRLRQSRLSVRDHGPGIAQEDLPRIFDRFYRAHAARGLPGSGLGLAIVQQVARAHGAEVTAESPSGGGTIIRLTWAAGEHAGG